MRILVLSKRQYSGYDILDHRFGRIREVPLELARLGHNVLGVTLSYRCKDECTTADGDSLKDGVTTWHSINLRNSFLPRPDLYLARVTAIAQQFHPDLIWACSDAYHAIFGARLATKLAIPCVVDLYDNFASFKATWLPGVLPRFKRAVISVEGVTCVSRSLADHILREYGRQKPTLVLENSVRPDLFFPRERIICRKQLDLPEEAAIIGTAGALDKSRGINTLFRAFELLEKNNPMLHLALAGPRSRVNMIPDQTRIHDFGILSLDAVPVFLNALDVAVICNRDSSFGRYCFPQKAYEIIACRVPLVAAGVATMNKLLVDYPQSLYEPEDPERLAQAIQRQLEFKKIIDIKAPSWADSAKKLDAFFHEVLKAQNNRISSVGAV